MTLVINNGADLAPSPHPPAPTTAQPADSDPTSPPLRVLVVDDESAVRIALVRAFAGEGWDVTPAADGPTALRAALTGAFDVIVLDIMLPGLSGYQVLRRLREGGIQTPVLVVSAKDSETDQSDGFNLGADGYLVKPFSLLVMLAQARALSRRRGIDQTASRLRLGELLIDPAAQKASWAGQPLPLSHREFGVLHALASHPHRAVSRTELLQLAWGDERAATPNAVEVYISYLRRKLHTVPAGPQLRTVRGRGYQLVVSR
jgi:DNA-binding response OmpR family regulator